jgi:uncharacterized protein (DUF433 family)
MGTEEKNGGSGSTGEKIQIDPLILSGKPFVRGTRLAVDFLQGLQAIGWSRENILGVYTYLAPEELDAALSFRPR